MARSPYEKPHGDLEAAEQEALDRLVQRMLDELRPCWPPRVGATCADLVFCPNPHHIQIAEYDEKGVSASFVVRSERASKFVHLFYPRETIEEVAPLLEEKT